MGRQVIAQLQTTFAKWQRLIPVAVFAIAAPVAAVAQDAAETPWAKICNENPQDGKELCLTIQEITAETGQFIASAAVREITGEDKKSFVIAVPPGMLLQPGMRAQVDDGKQYELGYGICLPNACYAELDVDASLVAEMKQGNQLVITTMNAQAKPVSFPMTLSGFTKAYDGEGLKPEGLAKRQQDLNKALRDRAAAERDRLKQEQEKSE
ncbi:MAG: invasion associated locus B family protein [Bauldia litoralis]